MTDNLAVCFLTKLPSKGYDQVVYLLAPIQVRYLLVLECERECYRSCRVGDIVDIKANGAVQKGMPHKVYHGKLVITVEIAR